MSEFTFTATAQCDYCGNYLATSDEDCDECSDATIHRQFFRHVFSQEMVVVESTIEWKWKKLEQSVEDWRSYEWLGTRSMVNECCKYGGNSPETISRIMHPIDASIDE